MRSKNLKRKAGACDGRGIESCAGRSQALADGLRPHARREAIDRLTMGNGPGAGAGPCGLHPADAAPCGHTDLDDAARAETRPEAGSAAAAQAQARQTEEEAGDAGVTDRAALPGREAKPAPAHVWHETLGVFCAFSAASNEKQLA